jgi:glucosamine 6-phosphate synthetase-like amidotransferase/phosphosugar isomerase protein
VVGARRNSPLVIGRGDGESFLASDVAAFIAYTRDAVELGQDQVAEVRAGQVTVTGFDGAPGQVAEDHVDGDVSAAEKADTLIEVPAVPTLLQPLITTVPLQVFACELATAQGHDVDQPRILAKSVTVE